MCGIVYAHDFKGRPVNNGVLQQFDKQRGRGTEGFGLFDGQELHIKKEKTENKMLKWLVKYDSNLILFHHRYPTSTVNVRQAAHPFSTKKYFGDTQYILVHNGMIANDDELFVKHQELGINYQSLLNDLTYNDSEALLWDFALFMEGQQPEMKVAGRIAFVCIKMVKGELKSLYFYRNGNPLNMLKSKEGIMLSSEGAGEEIDVDTLYNFSYINHRIYTQPLKLPLWDYSYTPTPSALPYSSSYCDPFSGSYSGGSYRGEPGDWLDPALRTKFGRFLADGSHEMEFEHDPDTQTYVPVDINDNDYEYEEFETYTPMQAEIDGMAMDYLATAHGHFEAAYWAIECDYEDTLDLADQPDVLRERRLMECAMDAIMADPENVDENAISSMWRAVWDQQKLAT